MDSSAYIAAIDRNMKIFEVFRALDIEMPIGQILFFLYAAKYEGSSLREIAERSDTVMSTASRYLGNLSIYRRDKKPGLKLLTSKVHPENRAKLTIELTEKGRLVLQQLM